LTYDPEQLGRSKADLAQALKQLRREAGLTGQSLARRCNMSQSKISKIENGRVTPSIVDVERMLRALNAPAELVHEIGTLARNANTEWQDIRASWRRGLEKRQAELAALETASTQLRYFLPSMITGLLGTPAYVRASVAYSPGDTSKTVAKKLERQEILYDSTKQFTFLLTEQAVNWAVLPPPAMAVQIDHLASLTHLPNVRIGVIPYGTQLDRGPMNTFTVYDDRLVTVETFTGRIVFQDPRDIAEHLALFAMYEARAVFDDGARDQLKRWAQLHRTEV
jgi:transcriptional regulator with XRE-family HTH domain